MDSFGPRRIRSLRGEQSRAAFARTLGVTAQTVYRWELPEGAAEARRPRGEQLSRLQRLAGGQQLTAAAPLAGAEDEDALKVLPALERVLRGDLQKGHAELLAIVTQVKQLSANARGLAYFGLAMCELLARSDARAALLMLGPLLSEAEAGKLDRSVAAKLFAAAALCHAHPDALLFDLQRVLAYQARIEAAGGEPEPACLACIAAVLAATITGDMELLERGFARLDDAGSRDLPVLIELHLEDLALLRGMLSSKTSLSLIQCQNLAQRAAERGYAVLHARALARMAVCQLDALLDPELVVETARKAKSLLASARSVPSFTHVLALRSEVEALLRVGRIDEALVAAAELSTWSEQTGVPAVAGITSQVRLFMLTCRTAELAELAASLRRCELPSLRSICQAYADFVDGAAALAAGDDPERAAALLDRAEAHALEWPFLVRDVLLHRIYAHLAAGHEVRARSALRRAQRHVDSHPSPWLAAQLRRLEGGLLAARGQWSEGRQLLQAACATFELAKDRCDAVLTRYLSCLIDEAMGEVDHASLAAAQAEVQALGLREPRSMQSGVAHFKRSLDRDDPQPLAAGVHTSETLIVPLSRVSIRGAAPNLILSELISVARELVPGRAVVMEELLASGGARNLLGEPLPDAGAEPEWLEFSDGAGRMLRLGAAGTLTRYERASLLLLVSAAAQALEIATLRGGAERSLSAGGELLQELPGFVAVSAEMRTLRAELKRLAASRSTVIITGESGSGKEVVAHAIHALSERGKRAYVAFNCATVPRDLFEGQLFGYRRGAFTGASVDHPGVIRSAHLGTLFLDEIGELPLDIQPKLLRFLENAEIFPLGERKPVKVDVRVLAATHRDLAALVRDGRFREDLYYRLQVVPVFIPPLRERRADVPELARHFLRELTRHGEPPVLAPDALEALLAQPFPGNVRELKNTLERALAYFPEQRVLRAEHLRPRRAAAASGGSVRRHD